MSLFRAVVLLIITAASIVAAQDDYGHVFTDAKRLYSAKNYDSVVQKLSPWVRSHGKDPSMEEMVPLLLESVLRTKDRSSFYPLRDIYLKKFPTSPFAPRIRYLSGMAVSDSSAFSAVLAFSAALKTGASGELAQLALGNVSALSQKRLSTDELTGLFDRSDLFGEVRTILGCALVKRIGKGERAEAIAEAVSKAGGSCTPLASPQSAIIEKTDSIPAPVAIKPPASNVKKIQIGLLAPLSGANADAGRSVARGVELAVALAEQKGIPVELVTLDTRGNYIETVRRTHELLDDKKVPVIIGPVLSVESAVAAGMILEHGNCAMISPTATEEGIAGLSENVFQLNLTLPTLARCIAEYAVRTAGITEFAIFAPATTYGKTMADCFRMEVKRLGGTILAQESFAEGGLDAAAAAGRLRISAGGTIWAKAVTAGTPIDGFPDRPTYLADADIGLGGIFIPSSASDAVSAITALGTAKLSAALLGSSGWQEPGLFDRGKLSLEGAVISGSASGTSGQEARFAAFAKLYSDRFKEAPDHVAAPLGYDAANIAIGQIAAGRTDGRSVSAGLRGVKNFIGVSGRASFDGSDGANTAATILRVENGSFIEVSR